jgi:DNA-binding CsgD family transcriptional regulator
MNNQIIQFSKREREIIAVLLQGKSNKQMALSLGISVSTVEYHLNNIYKKLEVSSRTEAVLRLGESTGKDIKGNSGESLVEIIGKTPDNHPKPVSTRGTPVKRRVAIASGSLITIILIVVIVFTYGRAQNASATPIPDPLLPDLSISSAYVSMVDGNGRCLTYYGLVVTVANEGTVVAPDVFLAESNTGQTVGIGTLDPHQSITLPLVAKAANGVYEVVVDPQNAIIESNEDNNSAVFSGPTATPPASCPTINWNESTPTPFLTEPESSILVQSTTPFPPGQATISTAMPQKYSFPMFTAPATWLLYTNPYPAYEIYYPPDVNLIAQELDSHSHQQRLTINLPVQSGTQMIDKYVIVDDYPALKGGCFAFGVGITRINDIDFVYQEGEFWSQISDHGADTRDVFQSKYTTSTPQNGFCYNIVLVMSKYNDLSLPIPSSSDTSLEILLDIISTLKIY